MINEGDNVLIWNPKKGDTVLLTVKKGATVGTHFGQIYHDEILSHDWGEGVTTPKGDVYYITKPTLADFTRRIKRQTQIVFPKEAGFIIQHLNFFPGARVVECGTGSGSLLTAFAHFVGDTGRIYTYDRREEFSKIAQKNAAKWGVDHRITFHMQDIENGFIERDADAVFLDVPNPYDHIGHAYDALAPGCRLGILVPTTNQISQTLLAMEKYNFIDVMVVELMLRYLKTDPYRIRPQDIMIGHTGYLIFGAKTLPIEDGVKVEEAVHDGE